LQPTDQYLVTVYPVALGTEPYHVFCSSREEARRLEELLQRRCEVHRCWLEAVDPDDGLRDDGA
jgi:hypothetical protein